MVLSLSIMLSTPELKKRFITLQCFPYIDQYVAQRHRTNNERHKLIQIFFIYIFYAILKYKYRSVH